MTRIDKISLGGGVAVGTLIFTLIAAWATHVSVAIGALIGGSAVSLGYGILLAVGVFFPPVGVIHGVGVWFGAW